jgi:hypothetical protein
MSLHKLGAGTIEIARFLLRIENHGNAVWNAMYLVARTFILSRSRTFTLGPTLACCQRFPSTTFAV